MKRHLTLRAFLIVLGTFAQSSFAGTLSDSPLALKSAVPANVLFPLSVEWPTADTAAYQGTNDYTRTNDYLGLFANDKCYTYDTTNGWFAPAAQTTDHTCSNQWSGNFLNWATMTGLDEFRFAMTGGNRYVDTATQTVLERTHQDGQGGFSNKSLTSSNVTQATPYPTGSSLTIVNAGKYNKMTVTLGGAGTANCTNPQKSGTTFSCDIALAGTGETGSCTTWKATGTGTSTNPFECQTFGSFTDVGSPTSTVVGTKTAVSNTSSDTVNCTGPSYQAATNPSFSCTITNAANVSGTCNTWIGNGTLSSPYTCTSFGAFGSASFVTSSLSSASTFSGMVPVTQAADTVTSCGTLSATKLVCSLTSGRTATCNSPSGSGTSSRPYNCTASNAWTIAGGSPAATYVDNTNATNTVISNSKYYRKPTTVTYSVPVSTTLYYIPTYSGSDTVAYYYYSTYAVNFGGSTDFFVRAKVCVDDSSLGIKHESNCTPYGTNTTTVYKPTGVIQKYGEQMRFGVFSYFNAATVDNAVMRSKLKYVAPNKWTSSGSTTANANKEWSATDGTYITNPDSAEAAASYGGAVSNSGVINYINKFGSMVSTTYRYKQNDDFSKLYYESLRYLRGLSPTLDFYSGATAANNDNFPIITAWDDPVQYSCQKNFVMTMGDTHTWCDKRLPGGTFSSETGSCTGKSTIPDKGSLAGDTTINVSDWTNALGALEGVSNLAATSYTSATGENHGASFYVAGLAYWAAKNGIRPSTDLTSHVPDNDPNNNLKVKTYVVDVQENKDLGINSQFWRAAKYGGVDSFDNAGNPLNWSTTINGYSGTWPKTLLPAGNPKAMIDAVQSALSSISSETGSGSAVGVSVSDLRTTNNGTNIYSATFTSGAWSGDLISSHMASDLSISTTPAWSASTYMTTSALNPVSGTKPWTTRKVITYNDGLNVDGTQTSDINGRQGVDFTTDGTNGFSTNFSPRQQAFLNSDPGSRTNDGQGDARVDFLRGDNSNEGTSGIGFRKRASGIGDFINSAPVYVALPAGYVAGDNYATYAANVATRTPMVYIGANDGMLHAFNADANSDGSAKTDSGKEVFAYVPSAVYANLSKLTWPNYSHKYFVDATPTVADAQLGLSCPTSDANKCWRTVLAGGLGAGGQGIYALDITDPATLASGSAKSIALWEFTDRDDADLGFTFAQPVIRKMNNGRWAVIVGNGYNNKTGDNDVGGDDRLGNGRAYLYILDLDGPGFDAAGRGRAWTLNTNYRKIELKSPTETTNTNNNGLSTVNGLDANNDGTVDYLYAGDRHGNLWKVDVSSSDPSNWKSAFGTVADPTPLFVATTADTVPLVQQITTSPLIRRHPNGGFMILFGTGSYVDQSDNTTPFSTNSFYGIWDKNDGVTTVSGRSKLQKQSTLAIASLSSGGATYALQSNCSPQYSSGATDPVSATMTCPAGLAPATNGAGKVDQQLGWVLDLNNTASSSAIGERYISSVLPISSSTQISFITLTPSSDPCTGQGYDFEYNLDYRSGGAPATPTYLTTSGTTTTPLTISFTTGSGSTAQTAVFAPSGMKLTGRSTGQNDSSIRYQTDPGSATATTGGCTPFISGQPCKKELKRCVISPGHACRSKYEDPTGLISWRQVIQ